MVLVLVLLMSLTSIVVVVVFSLQNPALNFIRAVIFTASQGLSGWSMIKKPCGQNAAAPVRDARCNAGCHAILASEQMLPASLPL